MQALTRAADRGVKVRIYLDGTQLADREPPKVFNDLAETPGVEIRTKHKSGTPMHLKSYQIDNRMLRTGGANFSASGLKRQDNDLVVIRDANLARSFAGRFDKLWDTARPLDEHIQENRPQAVPRTPTLPMTTECKIKSNVNRKGERIYHIPSDRD